LIWLLRHISVRLWLTAIISMPVSFYIVSQPGIVPDLINPVVLFLSIVLLVFIVFGSILNLIGKKMISKYIKEGVAWERAGIFKRSEEKYYKALRIYDSFLISPFSARSLAEKISGAVAKFMAVTDVTDTAFEKASTLFLRLSPHDEDMTLLWLRRLFQTKDLDLKTMDHDILTLIAENHHTSNRILPLLTNIFIQLERTDYTAQKVYKQALTYLKKDSSKRVIIQKLVRDNEEDGQIPSKLSFAKSSPVTRERSKKKSNISNLLKKIFSPFIKLPELVISTGKKFFQLISTNEKSKTYIRYSLIFLCLLLATGILFNTFSIVMGPKSETRNVKPDQVTAPVKAPPAPEMLYTIQIAAFLSKPHARKYSDRLIKSGLDARVVKVKGKSKTWFLVRISKFKDKSSAAAYGQKLKQEGLIKDFFVANK